jgi:hypothetical protein
MTTALRSSTWKRSTIETYAWMWSGPETIPWGGQVQDGGLGLDQEFFESVLVPQVMLYGFMGLEPNADGFEVSPRLPKKGWG